MTVLSVYVCLFAPMLYVFFFFVCWFVLREIIFITDISLIVFAIKKALSDHKLRIYKEAHIMCSRYA